MSLPQSQHIARTEKLNKGIKPRGDLSILILTAVIAAFGVVAVYSASNYNAQVQYGDAFYYVKKQLIGLILGLPTMLILGRMDCLILRGKRLRWVFLGLPILLLAMVFIPGIGRTNYGATRWIGIGPITIQPSELAKYGFVVFASAYAADNMEKVRTLKGGLPILLSGGVICLLILLEPNMSVTICVGFVMLCVLFAAGLKMKYFLLIFFPLLLAVPVLIIAEPYRLLRLSAFLDPWASSKEEGYQLIQSLYALGNGGWFGTGLFRSRQKYRFLPFSESDFILAVIGEELGFIGVLVLFGLSAFLIWRGVRAATSADDFFSFLLATGITAVYAVQTILNALVVSGAIPPTGLPLPLISSGNTSLIITMASMGVLYSVSAQGGGRLAKRKITN